jgi:hypothetical protein
MSTSKTPVVTVPLAARAAEFEARLVGLEYPSSTRGNGARAGAATAWLQVHRIV